MEKFDKVKAFVIGIIIYPIRSFLKPKKNVWVFGADLGFKYAQNSRYLFEYVLKNHPEIEAYWITQSREIYRNLKSKNIPVIFNYTFKGAIFSLTADLKLVSTWFSDIYYTFPSKFQKVSYLHHGMPFKKIFYDDPFINAKKSLFYRIKGWLYEKFLCEYKLEDSCFTPVTSKYFMKINARAMHNNNQYLCGQPRTDCFLHFDRKSIRRKYGISEDAFVITYMPTHRRYGEGDPCPHIFAANSDALKYFKEHNINIIWKQHVNMRKKLKKIDADPCLLEFSFDPNIDSQEIMFISDILITDFSSCFIDYMLLKRPILFYHYDDFEKTNTESYFNSSEMNTIGRISRTEKELFNDIRDVIEGRYDIDYSNTSNLFNECLDDQACHRCFEILKKIIDKD